MNISSPRGCARSCRQSSTPLLPGNIQSRNQKGKSCVVRACSASSALSTAMTSSPRRSINRARLLRLFSWSSTNRIFIYDFSCRSSNLKGEHCNRCRESGPPPLKQQDDCQGNPSSTCLALPGASARYTHLSAAFAHVRLPSALLLFPRAPCSASNPCRDHDCSASRGRKK